MPRVAAFSVLMFAIGAEPIPFSDFEFAKYAVTQGGLLVVVLLLLWWQRQDNKTKHRENSDKITLLTQIAKDSATAAERAAQASDANAHALHRLSAAVESLERHRR